MSFFLYLAGYIILIVGLALGADQLHVPPKWIWIGVICLAGIAVIQGVTSTRPKDRP